MLNPLGMTTMMGPTPEAIANQYHKSFSATETFTLPSTDALFVQSESKRRMTTLQLLKLHIDRAKMSLHDEKTIIYLQKPPMTHKTHANTISTVDQSDLDTSQIWEQNFEDELAFLQSDPDYCNFISDKAQNPPPTQEEAEKLASLMEQTISKKFTPEKLEQVKKPCILKCGNTHPFGSLKYCKLAIKKNFAELKKLISFGQLRCCFVCYCPARPGHNSTNCRFKGATCLVCKEKHSTVFCNKSLPREKIEALKSFLASETNLNSITTWENNDGEEPSDDEDETNYVNIIQSSISALSSNQAQWSQQQFTEEQDLAHNPVEDPAETNYINLINHLSPDIKEMEWLPHASSPVEMPVAGVQSTNSSSTRPATPKATATAAALVQTGLQPTKDPASNNIFNPSSTRAAAGA